MTNERLKELTDIMTDIMNLKQYLDDLENGCYDYFELRGRYAGDRNSDLILSFSKSEEIGLKEEIIKFLKEKLTRLEKEFEEA